VLDGTSNLAATAEIDVVHLKADFPAPPAITIPW
jgi:hypothetical protein